MNIRVAVVILGMYLHDKVSSVVIYNESYL